MSEYCIIVPCYNHGQTVAALLDQLQPMGMPVILVDDGSDRETARVMVEVAGKRPEVRVVRHDTNLGKGAAVETGMRHARESGYTHALQIDADGQHDTACVPAMLRCSRSHPEALVSGQPLFDESVPRFRFYGRYLTHFWVWVETLSFGLRDSMCGFRVYPLPATLAILDRYRVGKRMEFDTEIMVRLYWAGVPVRFVPVRVVYPEGGISHFRSVRDNIAISAMHTRLFFGMLGRIPTLLRLRNRESSERNQHWSEVKERGVLWGMRFLLFVYRVLGRRCTGLLLQPVVGFFWLTGWRARNASAEFLERVHTHAQRQGKPLHSQPGTYAHFSRFAEAALEKLAGWLGDLDQFPVETHGEEILRELHESKEGALVLGSHLGNFELCRILGEKAGIMVNAVVFTQHAQRFTQLLKEANPDSHTRLIETSEIGPDTAIAWKCKLERGEWIAITADRTPVGSPGRVVQAPFLGELAAFPQSPFLLASLLDCPVLLLFAIRRQGITEIHLERFPVESVRGANREQALCRMAEHFAGRLEHYAMLAPLDWFNFYPFWQKPNQTQSRQRSSSTANFPGKGKR